MIQSGVMDVAVCGILKKIRDRLASKCILFPDPILSDMSEPEFLFMLATKVTTTTRFTRVVCPPKSSVAI
jgi:hypothetical protein